MLRLAFDVNGLGVTSVHIVRKEPHHRLKRAYWYDYTAQVDTDIDPGFFKGRVVHSYDNGAVALAQKVLKDIVRQQKEARRGSK